MQLHLTVLIELAQKVASVKLAQKVCKRPDQKVYMDQIQRA